MEILKQCAACWGDTNDWLSMFMLMDVSKKNELNKIYFFLENYVLEKYFKLIVGTFKVKNWCFLMKKTYFSIFLNFTFLLLNLRRVYFGYNLETNI